LIIKLISLYELKPCLYNIKDKEYHNRIKRKLAVEFIAKELGDYFRLINGGKHARRLPAQT
jgi:uncharacterized protein (DUF2164 family)